MDKPAAYVAPTSEDDLILHTLDGLPIEYRPFQTSIQTQLRFDPFSLKELHALLICKVLSIEEKTVLTPTNEPMTALSLPMALVVMVQVVGAPAVVATWFRSWRSWPRRTWLYNP